MIKLNLMQYFKTSKLMQKFHDEQNNKTFNKDRASITVFPFTSGSNVAQQSTDDHTGIRV